MGHYYFNYIQAAGYEQLPAELQCGLPVEEFIKRTVHTHIHGLSQQRTTHFPMKPDESLPLETYIHSLQKTGYSGVYNLELDFQRFIEEKNMLQQVYETIDRLKRCIH